MDVREIKTKPGLEFDCSVAGAPRQRCAPVVALFKDGGMREEGETAVLSVFWWHGVQQCCILLAC